MLEPGARAIMATLKEKVWQRLYSLIYLKFLTKLKLRKTALCSWGHGQLLALGLSPRLSISTPEIRIESLTTSFAFPQRRSKIQLLVLAHLRANKVCRLRQLVVSASED